MARQSPPQLARLPEHELRGISRPDIGPDLSRFQCRARQRPEPQRPQPCGSRAMERTGIEPLTSGLQTQPGVHDRARRWPNAVFQTGSAWRVALWVFHTHAFVAAEATPYLAITSAVKESGKTQLLEAPLRRSRRPRPPGVCADQARPAIISPTRGEGKTSRQGSFRNTGPGDRTLLPCARLGWCSSSYSSGLPSTP